MSTNIMTEADAKLFLTIYEAEIDAVGVQIICRRIFGFRPRHDNMAEYASAAQRLVPSFRPVIYLNV